MSDFRERWGKGRGSIDGVELDFEHCYRAVSSKDGRFDGWFVTAVTSTGIYCRPSCPAITPKRRNVRFYRSSAAAQRNGFRACRRCRPDAAPGSPEWDSRADVVGRAMRLIADGVVDRVGVPGLADRLGYTERHLNRMLTTSLGAGPLALARAQRAQTARILIETTALGFAEVAFAAGFGSVRQFNETVREVYAASPSQLRTAAPAGPAEPGTLTVRLAYREPLHVESVFGFLAARALSPVEDASPTAYLRAVNLPHGAGTVSLTPKASYVQARLRLADVRDLAPAVARCRRLLDLDADPVAVDAVLAQDEALAPMVAKDPGVRVPGAVDGFEIAVRAIVGQQVSVAGARTTLSRLVRGTVDPPERRTVPASSRLEGRTEAFDVEVVGFPDAAAVAGAPDEAFGMPASRRHSIRALAEAVAGGDIDLDGGMDRGDVEHRLLAISGIGPWTAGYVALRALGDPDAFLPTDLGVRRGAAALGLPDHPAALAAHAKRWSPWRGYALMRLWRAA